MNTKSHKCNTNVSTVISRSALERHNPSAWCCLLGLLGFSGATIARETGIPLWRVWRELKANNISLKAYRRGESPMSRYIIQHTEDCRSALTIPQSLLLKN